MNANDAKVLSEQAIAKDFINFPKYLRKAIAIVEAEIKKACEKGFYELEINKRNLTRHVKLSATAQEVELKLVAHFRAAGFKITAYDNDDYVFAYYFNWKK